MGNSTNIELVKEIIDDLLHILCKEHETLAGELARMRIIVDEASNNLQESFNGMNKENQLLKQKMDSLFADDTREMDIMGLNNENMSKFLSLGIRSLQFDDIMQQMINHANRRVTILMALLEYVKQQSNGNNFSNADQQSILEMLEKCKAQINETKKTLELDNPVTQHSMNSGDIELF